MYPNFSHPHSGLDAILKKPSPKSLNVMLVIFAANYFAVYS